VLLPEFWRASGIQNILTRSCVSLQKMMSQSDQQGAGIELKKLGGQLALKYPYYGKPISLELAGSALQFGSRWWPMWMAYFCSRLVEARGAACPEGSVL
jgi:hypothetical protein